MSVGDLYQVNTYYNFMLKEKVFKMKSTGRQVAMKIQNQNKAWENGCDDKELT